MLKKSYDINNVGDISSYPRNIAKGHWLARDIDNVGGIFVSAAPSPKNLNLYKKMNFDLVINLLTDKEKKYIKCYDESLNSRILTFSLPIVTGRTPESAQETYRWITELLFRYHQKGDRILVYSKTGHGRANLVASIIFMILSDASEKSEDMIKLALSSYEKRKVKSVNQIWRTCFENGKQLKFLSDCSKIRWDDYDIREKIAKEFFIEGLKSIGYETTMEDDLYYLVGLYHLNKVREEGIIDVFTILYEMGVVYNFSNSSKSITNSY